MSGSFEEEGVFYVIIANDHTYNPGHPVTVKYDVHWYDGSPFVAGIAITGIIVIILLLDLGLLWAPSESEVTEKVVKAPA